MKLELDTKLCNDFPELFVNRYRDPKTTAMCWGFDCGDGWYDLIHNLCNDIVVHCVATGQKPPVVQQVKEKFGMLRFYIDMGDDYIWDLISAAEKKSATVCDTCGKKGKIRTGSWIYVSCEEHLRAY